MSRILKIATRKSPLALWQANFVRDRLLAENEGLEVELVTMLTQGDKILDTPLAKIGGKGLFIKELEQGMLAGEADIAVHSMKDVPMDLPGGFSLPVICEREVPLDAFVSHQYDSIEELPEGACVGTSSLRRSSQILSLKTLLDDMNSPMHHIKAHGALYNDLAKGGTLAEYYLETIAPYRDSALVYVPCGSVFARMARALGFKVWEEAFMDRAYEPDGSLVSRKLPGSLLTTAEEVGAQLQEMVLHHRVKCRDGSYFSLEAQTYCLHGDTPNASEILMYLTESLLGELIQIRQ